MLPVGPMQRRDWRLGVSVQDLPADPRSGPVDLVLTAYGIAGKKVKRYNSPSRTVRCSLVTLTM
jgi:hypothetical protein